MSDKFVVTRTENDDGTYHGGTEYLRVDKNYGTFEWEKHPAHATKLPLYEAIMFMHIVDLTHRTSPADVPSRRIHTTLRSKHD